MNAFKKINIYLQYTWYSVAINNAIFIDNAFLTGDQSVIDFREKSKNNFSSTFFKRVVKIYGVL